MRKKREKGGDREKENTVSIDRIAKHCEFKKLTLRMSMNCLEPTLSAWTRKALSYVSRSLQSLTSYCWRVFWRRRWRERGGELRNRSKAAAAAAEAGGFCRGCSRRLWLRAGPRRACYAREMARERSLASSRRAIGGDATREARATEQEKSRERGGRLKKQSEKRARDDLATYLLLGGKLGSGGHGEFFMK